MGTKYLLACASWGALALASTAQAQSVGGPAASPPATSGAGAELQEVVVTARRVQENLQSVPIAVSAFSARQLEAKNVVEVKDLTRITPGLFFQENASNREAFQLSLRGLVQTDIVATLDPEIGIYVDGVYWARAYGINNDFLDLQDVQVLKGPQGTLFGRNTAGGAVVVQTNDPNFRGFSGLVSGTYGRFNEADATAIVNMPLVSDKLALRLAIERDTRDGYAKDIISGREIDNRDRWSARAKLLWQPTSDFSVVASAESFDTKSNGPYRTLAWADPNGLAALQAGGATVINAYVLPGSGNKTALQPMLFGPNPLNFNDTRTRTFGVTAKYETPIGVLKLITAYRSEAGVQTIDDSSTPFPIINSNGLTDLQQGSAELQLTGAAFDNKWDYAAGLFYFHEHGLDSSLTVNIPAFAPSEDDVIGHITNSSAAAYAQSTYHFGSGYSITGGLRYSTDWKGLSVDHYHIGNTSGVYSCAIPGQLFPNCNLNQTTPFSSLSYTASIEKAFSEDGLVYLKSSSGFRAGGQNFRPTSADLFLPFKPETNYEQEIGVKSEFLDRRIRANFAAYYSYVTDIQENAVYALPNGDTGVIVQNAGAAQYWGFEGDITAIIFDGLQLNAAFATVAPKYIRYMTAAGDQRNQRFQDVPPGSFTLSGQYAKELTVGRLQLNADYDWQGKTPLQTYNNPSNPNNATIIADTTRPASGVLNARATLSILDRRLDLAVWGRNLTNNRLPSTSLFVGAPLNYIQNGYTEPLSFGVTVTYRFGVL